MKKSLGKCHDILLVIFLQQQCTFPTPEFTTNKYKLKQYAKPYIQ